MGQNCFLLLLGFTFSLFSSDASQPFCQPHTTPRDKNATHGTTSTSEAHGKQALTESSSARKTHEPCVLVPKTKLQINFQSDRSPSQRENPNCPSLTVSAFIEHSLNYWFAAYPATLKSVDPQLSLHSAFNLLALFRSNLLPLSLAQGAATVGVHPISTHTKRLRAGHAHLHLVHSVFCALPEPGTVLFYSRSTFRIHAAVGVVSDQNKKSFPVRPYLPSPPPDTSIFYADTDDWWWCCCCYCGGGGGCGRADLCWINIRNCKTTYPMRVDGDEAKNKREMGSMWGSIELGNQQQHNIAPANGSQHICPGLLVGGSRSVGWQTAGRPTERTNGKDEYKVEEREALEAILSGDFKLFGTAEGRIKLIIAEASTFQKLQRIGFQCFCWEYFWDTFSHSILYLYGVQRWTSAMLESRTCKQWFLKLFSYSQTAYVAILPTSVY